MRRGADVASAADAAPATAAVDGRIREPGRYNQKCH